MQLKLWSKNLDPLLSVENLFKPNGIPHNEDGGNTQIVLMMHLLQLFAIMLLCRPFSCMTQYLMLIPHSPKPLH